MTNIEQAARAEAVRDIEGLRDLTTEEVFAEGASWLAEYLLSDDSMEKAARGIHDLVEFGTPWEETSARQRLMRTEEARAALHAVLGKEPS